MALYLELMLVKIQKEKFVFLEQIKLNMVHQFIISLEKHVMLKNVISMRLQIPKLKLFPM